MRRYITSTLGFITLTLLETAIRRTYSSISSDGLSAGVSSTLDKILDNHVPLVDSDESSDFPDVSMIGEYSAKMKGKAVPGRESLSSVTSANNYNESSGYSTPATSAAQTPANADLPKPATATSNRRGRRPATATTLTMQSTTPSVNAVARAAALRNSQFSLNPIANKRKRRFLSDNEDDEDDDNTPDAQLARALQEQDDAAANTMTGLASSYSQRRTPRNAQKILPMIDFASEFSDDDLEAVASSARPAKKPKIELGPLGSNEVKFSPRKQSFRSMVIEDSDDSDIPIAMSTSRSRAKAAKAPPFKVEKQSPKFKIPARPARPAKASSSAFSSESFSKPTLKKEDTKTSTSSDVLSSASSVDFSEVDLADFEDYSSFSDDDLLDPFGTPAQGPAPIRGPRSFRAARQMINLLEDRQTRRGRQERERLEKHHPELHTMWKDLENLPKIGDVKIEQPTNINRELKPFQLEGVAWMRAMEKTEWGGGLLGDEMGMGKTIQAVSLIMSDFPAAQPSLVLIPPVALMQWQQEIKDYTDGTLKTFVFHGTNAQTKNVTLKELKKYDVILMSYNSLESMYRKQEKGFKRKNGIHKEESVIHQIHFHRVILDEAHNIKVYHLISIH
jgi:DNA repair protein RAD16